MVLKIAILEDNEDRQAEMRSCLADRFYQYEIRFFDRAAEMIDFLKENLDEVLVLCLDHDLELKPGRSGRRIDPGTGRDVADYLAGNPPVCPVVIHTTNVPAALGMERVLRDSHWETHHVLPYGDLEWIQEQWFRTVRRAIVGSVKDRVEPPQINSEGNRS
jgi:hypothetical protein